MKCPLKFIGEYGFGQVQEEHGFDCHEEKCGQYDQANRCCAPVALNQILVAIGNTLGEIVNQLYNNSRG